MPDQSLRFGLEGALPNVIQVGLSAIVWFLAVIWLNFAGGAEVGLRLALVTGFLVVLLTLLLVTVSMAINDPRSQPPRQAGRTVRSDS